MKFDKDFEGVRMELMDNQIDKEKMKQALTEVLEPFAGAIKKDFDRVDGRIVKIDERFDKVDENFVKIDERFDKVDERFNKIEIALISLVEDSKEARKERQNLEKRINETYNAVDGFIKIVDRLETEFTVIKEDLRRVKEVIKEKMGVDLF